ncbi:3-hydroxybenzoate 6-monooxygenase [Massilia solisilvae]|uniref:3-hydroxybenzoate 6-monooxygenase n=1 Tax=Massilia solisilvae TaxID=1811225 RepID=A0ABT2BN51_9BURK|nr:3-hydroxybenzoate 6-monooxygenase [Massilia solisilvae]MCS0609892.1 3-hydroxybenzoate 6-monooxygenase [Massilia solisilvae]
MHSSDRESARALPSVIVAGAGIGGIAAALALAKQGLHVTVLEQAAELGEIGAGLQLGPNAFAALDALGAGERVRELAVFTERLVMMDAVDCGVVASFDVGDAFRARFNNPYAVIHRADIHTAILEQVRGNPLIELVTSCRIESIGQDEQGVTVTDSTGRAFRSGYLIGCDGVRSIARETVVGDGVRVSGHVVYRAVVPVAAMPEELRMNAPVVWAGPNCHLVHYPLRGGELYNLVVTFHSREQETWGVTEGSQEEVLSYFTGIAELPRKLLSLPSSWRRWSTADREPVDSWTRGRITLLGDAAHPMMQYLAQGACMALEDAVTLGEAVRHCEYDMQAAFALYQRSRIARTARVVLSVREMGRLYHAAGVERLVRNELWKGRSAAGFYEALAWLYDWNVANCLAKDA